jgi:hypothetical protein
MAIECSIRNVDRFAQQRDAQDAQSLTGDGKRKITMDNSKAYHVEVRSSDEFSDTPAVVEFNIDEEAAQEIIRLAGIVKANGLYKVEKFDCRARYLRYDPEQDPESAKEEGEKNQIPTELDRLNVSGTEFWFSGYLKDVASRANWVLVVFGAIRRRPGGMIETEERGRRDC